MHTHIAVTRVHIHMYTVWKMDSHLASEIKIIYCSNKVAIYVIAVYSGQSDKNTIQIKVEA